MTYSSDLRQIRLILKNPESSHYKLPINQWDQMSKFSIKESISTIALAYPFVKMEVKNKEKAIFQVPLNTISLSSMRALSQ